jgi:protoporphyrinogen oxidase
MVIEKASVVGGLAKTHVIKEGTLEFRTDHGPHRFFSKNRYLHEFVADLLDEKWRPVTRQTRQYIDGKFFDYPIRAIQVVKNLDLSLLFRAVVDYAVAVVRYRVLKRPIVTFQDFAYASFGRTLAEFNILNYTEKVWGIRAQELHPDWAEQRIAGLNLRTILLAILMKSVARAGGGGSPRSLVDQFWYPEMGTGLIYQTIADKIEAAGRELRLNCEPKVVRHNGSRITEVELTDGTTVVPKSLVQSVRPAEFLRLMHPAPPPMVQDAADQLRYRSQVYLFITLDKERITADQWIYFPEPEIPFERWSEMKNFSERMSPPNKTSLLVEYFCFETDPQWTMSAEELLKPVVAFAGRTGLFKRSDVRNAYKMWGDKDYPIYDLRYREHLQVVKSWFSRFTNLYCIGRPGRFKYTNQDHSLEMGILAAWSIIEGRPHDLDAVGAAREYFEKAPAFAEC